MLAAAALLAGEDTGTLGGSALASWSGLVSLLIGFAVILVVLAAMGRTDRSWGALRFLSRIPAGITRITGVPGWAATAIGMSLYGLLIAGQGFYSDVSWHIALGRDKELFTAPHAGILIGLVFILGGAMLGTFVATMDRVEPALRLGGLHIPRSLLPLWALGLGAVSGFPLDEVWHREYGVDVTMWSPTHMLMILGATFTGLAFWLILAETNIKPTDSRWARGIHVLCGWLAVQGLLAPSGEFTFGVPQFSLLFSPILICLAAGVGIIVLRLVHGPWWGLGIIVFNFVLSVTEFTNFGGDDSPVETRFAGGFVVSALLVELIARLLGTENRLRFAVVSGVAIGTVGLAGEFIWNQDAPQPWTSALLPEVFILGTIAAVGAAILGVAFARAFRMESSATRVPGPLLALATVACLATILFPMRRPTGDVEAAVRFEPAGEGTATVVATLAPASAADDAYWFQATAWQGGGLELADMKPTGNPGEYRSDQPIPLDGKWKSLLRLHRGAEMMAVPLFLPADPEIDKGEIPAVDKTLPFETERLYLLRETHSGNGWLSPVVHGYLVAMAGVWALAFVFAVRRLTDSGQAPRPRGATRLVSEPIPST